MHAVAGIHSAMAIKRQRHRREVAARERERRLSTHSSESGDTHHSLHGSTRRKYRHHASGPTGSGMLDTKVVTSIGMLHIGVVFLVFGIFLLGAGLLPNDVSGVNVGKILIFFSNISLSQNLFTLRLRMISQRFQCIVRKIAHFHVRAILSHACTDSFA